MNFFSKHIEVYRTSRVFVPGGLPKLTYNPRKTLDLETQLKKAKDNLCKLVMVTGSTKSGKTVLTTTVFGREDAIWFDGGAYSNEEEFWKDIVDQLDVPLEENRTQTSSETSTSAVAADIEKNFLIVKAKIGGNVGSAKSDGYATSSSIKRGPKALALRSLSDSQKPLIIDDFHYIPREHQALIVRALKAVIFEGVPVVFLAIPHRRLDAVKVEREMTGRVDTISVPAWELNELAEIANKGFPLLNIKIDNRIVEHFSQEAIGSPHLMQEFCRAICSHYGVEETSAKEVEIKDISLDHLFKQVAVGTGKIMFDKLSRGPRQRSDRLPRTLKSGRRTDIYGLVLQGLAEIRPGMDKVDYEELRTKIRDISAEKPPEAHEISRVLEHMSNIASSDESSTPVLDWEKEDRVLHITDPFFAYYLRWGIEKVNT